MPILPIFIVASLGAVLQSSSLPEPQARIAAEVDARALEGMTVAGTRDETFVEDVRYSVKETGPTSVVVSVPCTSGTVVIRTVQLVSAPIEIDRRRC